jgi:hypothetical protein
VNARAIRLRLWWFVLGFVACAVSVVATEYALTYYAATH